MPLLRRYIKRMDMEHYVTFACFCMALTALGLFGIVKACDWLIGLKYISKDNYKAEMLHFSEDLTKLATIESHNYLKEDIDEIKSKLNDIHEVVMTFAVNSFNRNNQK